MASQGRYRVAFNKTSTGALVSAASSTTGRICIWGFSWKASAALTAISLVDTAGSPVTLWGPVDCQAGDGAIFEEGDFPLFEMATKGKDVNIAFTGTGNIGGHISYSIEGL